MADADDGARPGPRSRIGRVIIGDLAGELREARSAAGLSQAAVARAAGLTQSRIERAGAWTAVRVSGSTSSRRTPPRWDFGSAPRCTQRVRQCETRASCACCSNSAKRSPGRLPWRTEAAHRGVRGPAGVGRHDPGTGDRGHRCGDAPPGHPGDAAALRDQVAGQWDRSRDPRGRRDRTTTVASSANTGPRWPARFPPTPLRSCSPCGADEPRSATDHRDLSRPSDAGTRRATRAIFASV